MLTAAFPYGTNSTTILWEPRASYVGVSWSLMKRMESGHRDSYMTWTCTCGREGDELRTVGEFWALQEFVSESRFPTRVPVPHGTRGMHQEDDDKLFKALFTSGKTRYPTPPPKQSKNSTGSAQRSARLGSGVVVLLTFRRLLCVRKVSWLTSLLHADILSSRFHQQANSPGSWTKLALKPLLLKRIQNASLETCVSWQTSLLHADILTNSPGSWAKLALNHPLLHKRIQNASWESCVSQDAFWILLSSSGWFNASVAQLPGP
ncbi:Light-independent protochlorophyllide reductase subunit N [Frankliniella fusca]|uniref:Light-independent protochlorophyllide reductase subunit N n=1 Tax=Frankliniella fusca TaxID=407009 RepID=A0AAE1HWV6_9NEOP|nr:Light-independent protochlorophyllide reductase subunit N [Frankliniella fusca]